MLNLNKFNTVKKSFEEMNLPYIPQNDYELQSFCHVVETLNPQVFVEIGTRNGGSTWILSHFMTPGTTIVSIDLSSDKNTEKNKKLVLGKIKQNGHDVHSIPFDSTLPETIRKLKNILNGRAIDCLFIDGDHGWDGVVKDWENYNQFVRKDGVIAFHDIVHSKKPWKVYMLWRVLRTVFKFEEFIAPNSPMGIGIIYKS